LYILRETEARSIEDLTLWFFAYLDFRYKSLSTKMNLNIHFHFKPIKALHFYIKKEVFAKTPTYSFRYFLVEF
jgi:hypothetical protein